MGPATVQVDGFDDFLSKCGPHVANAYTADDFANALGGFEEIQEMFELITSNVKCTQCLGKIMNTTHLKSVWEQIAIERQALGLGGRAAVVDESARRAAVSDAGLGLDIVANVDVDMAVKNKEHELDDNSY